MEKMKLHSPDLTQANIEKIRELFPDCVTEAQDEETGALRLAVDFDQLRQELSDHIVEGPQERYQLDWPGKRKARRVANKPITETLRPYRKESVNFDDTKNLFIEGDNLKALKLLQETYLGKVKLIYIDPPYNTGQDFIYKDDFAEDANEYHKRTNQKNEDGYRLVANTDSNGRLHSDWLSSIYPRLKLAKNLLHDDGAIFVSCDENEHPRLRALMDEIFGQENFVSDMVWAAGRKNDSRLVSISHEYIVCYAKDAQNLSEKKIEWRQRKKGLDEIYAQYQKLKKTHDADYSTMTAKMGDWYKNLKDEHPSKNHRHYKHIDERGVYFASDISWPGGGGPRYEVIHPTTKMPVKIPSRGWRISNPEKMFELIKDNRVHFGATEDSVPCVKSYLKDKEYSAPYSVFYQDGRAATKRLRALMGCDCFDFPKDERVLRELIEMITDNNDIVMDFFAGSATTAHAVMQINADDGGNRKFIMVQLPEQCAPKSEADKAGYTTIAEIGKERIRRAGAKILEGKCHKNWQQDIGFRTLKIDSSNRQNIEREPHETEQADFSEFVDNFKSDRTGEDLLFQVLVDLGIELDASIRLDEHKKKKDVYFVNENELIACFDKIDDDLVKIIADHKPERVVFRDNGFTSDAMKANIAQFFRQKSRKTKIKVI